MGDSITKAAMKLYTAFIFSFLFTGCVLSSKRWMPDTFSERVVTILQCISGEIRGEDKCLDFFENRVYQNRVKQDLAYCNADETFYNANKVGCYKLISFCPVQDDGTVVCRVDDTDEQAKDGIKSQIARCEKTSTYYYDNKEECDKLNSICSIKNDKGEELCKIDKYIYYLLKNKKF